MGCLIPSGRSLLHLFKNLETLNHTLKSELTVIDSKEKLCQEMPLKARKCHQKSMENVNASHCTSQFVIAICTVPFHDILKYTAMNIIA